MSDLDNLARELTAAADGIDSRKLLEVEAVTMKRDWQSAWSGIRGMPHIGVTVTYDIKTTASGAEAEVGPDPSRMQGPLDNIVEYGSSLNGPIRPVTEQLASAAGDRLEKYLATQVGKLL